MQKIYVDLFAGCGGLSLGLHNAGWKGLFAVEKSPDAFRTLEYNLIEKTRHFDWPEWLPRQNHDIKELLANYKTELNSLNGQVDLVVGGPPCQGFSMAGRRQEADLRNQLVKAYIEFINIVKPKAILLENVRGFTIGFETSDNGKRGIPYSVMVQKLLHESGYEVQGRLLNLGDYGVPQNRVRFILVGVRKDYAIQHKNCKAKHFFNALNDNKGAFLKNKGLEAGVSLGEAISDLWQSNGSIPSPDSPRFRSSPYARTRKTPYQELMRRGIKPSDIPDSHRFANHNSNTISKFADILQHAERNKNLGPELRSKYNIKKHTIIPLGGAQKSPTITTLPDDYIHYREPRILTVREYARIQSFPDTYEFKGKYTTGGKERTQQVPRYSQVGNAIPPLFAEQAGLALFNILETE